MDRFLDTVEFFIIKGKENKFPSNKWMYHCKEQEVYLRMGNKIVGNEILNCLTIANIKTQEKHQKKGLFTNFLKWLEQFEINIYVENAHNPVLHDFLIRNGFTRNNKIGYEYDFYKITNEKRNQSIS